MMEYNQAAPAPRPPVTRPKQELPESPNKPDATVYEPESLKKARAIPGLTEQQARAREQRSRRGW